MTFRSSKFTIHESAIKDEQICEQLLNTQIKI